MRDAHDDLAASEIVGSVPTVMVTVGMVGGLALMLNAFHGPVHRQHTGLAVSVEPGLLGWNSGDEAVAPRRWACAPWSSTSRSSCSSPSSPSCA
jgi:hypothetical protein